MSNIKNNWWEIPTKDDLDNEYIKNIKSISKEEFEKEYQCSFDDIIDKDYELLYERLYEAMVNESGIPKKYFNIE